MLNPGTDETEVDHVFIWILLIFLGEWRLGYGEDQSHLKKNNKKTPKHLHVQEILVLSTTVQ